jgi:acyl carrier protein
MPKNATFKIHNIKLSHENLNNHIIIINMEIEEIKKRVKKVTAKVLKINESEISDTAYFTFDLGASSLQSVLLVAGFEEEFNIELDEDKSLEIQTVSEAVDFIRTYLS